MTDPSERAAATALITGASSGLGLELARLFAADGHDVVLVARTEAKLRELAAELTSAHGIRTLVIAVDLARQSAPTEIVNRVRSERIEIDFLVNNAGFGLLGPFASTERGIEMAMLQVNIAALTDLTKQLLPEMLERRRGRILNVASTAAFSPGPFMAVYYASKAYVLSFSQALANELKGTGVTCTAFCPGPTRTGFAARAHAGTSGAFRGFLVRDAPGVARAGYRGMMRGEMTVVPGLLNKLLTQGTRFISRGMQAAVARRAATSRGHA
jgi:short-subunit dehydrogenase